MKIEISPSILSADLGRINEELKDMEDIGADRVHFDVMDGHFVNNLTFGAPFLKKLQTKLPIEIHLMVENPEQYFEDYANSLPGGRKPNKDVILVHAEVCDHLHGTIQKIKSYGFKAGVVLNPATSLVLIEEIVDDLDQVLIMSVNPGYSGQQFIDLVLHKIFELREALPDLDIEVDGGINSSTCRQVVEAGANILVSGSYLFGADDRKKAIKLLKS